MHIAIDASRAFISKRTGTENYSYQLIRAIANIDRKNKYILYTRKVDDRKLKVDIEDRSWKLEKKNLSSSFQLQDLNSTFYHQPSNYKIKQINFSRLWTQIGLAKEVFLNPPDVLFIPAHTLPLLRRPGLKTVVTIHDLGYEYLPQYHQFPQKLYLNKSTEFAVKHATHLIAVSQATKKDLINKLHCPEEKITVIYEGFDSEKFSPKKNLKIKNLIFIKNLKFKIENYILFVGTLQPRKNIARLIEAFSIYCHCEDPAPYGAGGRGNLYKIDSHGPLRGPRNDKRVELIIAGSKGWLYDEILAAPKKFGVGSRVKFLGYTSDEDLAKLYSGALCLCLPSLFEGFGLPVLEAMACGCPVVVSNNSSLPEVAGDAGLYVDPYDVNDIASKLKLIMENGKLRMEMREKGLKQAQKFSWEKCARETIEVLTR